MSGRLLGLAIALGALRLAGSPLHESAPFFTRISGTAVIPAEVSNDAMFVSVMINGQGPFRMQVDTGCSYSMISPDVAAAVEARGMDGDQENAEALNGFGSIVSMPQVVLDTVSIGPVQFEGVEAGVVPLELQSKVDSRTLDGLLGYSLFSDLFFALDFPHKSLVLSEGRPAGLPPVRAELDVIDEVEVPYIAVRLQGRTVDVMIDSGYNGRLHLPPEALAWLKWKVKPRPGYLLAVAGQVGRGLVGRLSGDLEMGPVRQADPVAEISPGPASVGMGLLDSFCLVFDESGEKLWLCSPRGGPLPSPPERSVGLSLLAESGGWWVAGVMPDSPAAKAGLKEGDLATEIEGRPARDWSREEIQDWINTHASLALRLSGPSGPRDVTLPVWSLVP